MYAVDDTSAAATAAALDRVGPRLRRLRTQRRITLTGLATTTGISESTLSRLENGQRRPTLELLLALSLAYRVGRPGERVDLVAREPTVVVPPRSGGERP
jgi:transcriptional regulator with XRE-family HTH domain